MTAANESFLSGQELFQYYASQLYSLGAAVPEWDSMPKAFQTAWERLAAMVKRRKPKTLLTVFRELNKNGVNWEDDVERLRLELNEAHEQLALFRTQAR